MQVVCVLTIADIMTLVVGTVILDESNENTTIDVRRYEAGQYKK